MKCDQIELKSQEDELPCSSNNKAISIPKVKGHILSGCFGDDLRAERHLSRAQKQGNTDCDRSQRQGFDVNLECPIKTQLDELHEWCQGKLSGHFSPRYQVLSFTQFNPKTKTISVRNNFKHLDTKRAVFRSCVLKDGHRILGSDATVTIAAGVGEMQEVTLNTPSFYEFDAMYHLNLYVKDPYTDDDVLCHQLRLHHLVKQEVLMADVYAAIEVVETQKRCEVHGEHFSLSFHKETGFMDSYFYHGESLLSQPMSLLCNRGPMNYEDNEHWHSFTREWSQEAVESTTQHFSIVVVNDSRVRITIRSVLANGSVVHTIYKVYADGRVWVRQTFKPSSHSGLSMIGFKIPLGQSYSEFRYFGKGPHANYQNLNDDLGLAVYQELIEEVSSKTFKNHTQVFWASLTNSSQRGVMIKSDRLPLNVGACRSDDDCVACIVAVDVVGWLSKHDPQFMDVHREYHYEFEMVPVTKGQEDVYYKVKMI
ncbi:2-dioxygenase [Erysipelothrix amsterdamensis]|uniref:beta-galactosidase n=1 Tax=Erysipelothrix amsterdamensis TaxID=2929157 RepID=A0AAU9VEU6_9FIRM|nr:2-dioxygenase [Erysipelothrix sp. A18Y020d]CAH2761426.1 2-dioxygenase [Erysipelothrix sp. A18Y020d]